MNDSTLRIKSPADLLALVPCVIGFHPQDSLVLVVLAGEGSNLHARVDLLADDDVLGAGLACLVSAVRRNGAHTVALIAYTPDPLLAEDAVDQLSDVLDEIGVEVVAAIRADDARWYSLDCDDDCCPPEGRPYDLSAHPFTAQSVLEGKVTFGSRRELADSLVAADPDGVEEVAAAAAEATRRLQTADRDPFGVRELHGHQRHLVAEGRWVRDRVRTFLATREPLTADEVGRLVIALSSIDVRDVAWSEMSRDSAPGHVELWRDVLRRTPLDLLAPPAALLGFAAWLSGDGALAWCAVDRCRESDPDYGMAALLAQALLSAIPPTTWRPVAIEDLPLFAG